MGYPQMLSIFITLLYIYGTLVSCQFANFNKLVLPQGVTGPESASFEGLLTNGPFTTVADGRILYWQGPTVGFVDFAYTSPKRTKQLCDGTTDPDKWPICGRPIALSFHPIKGLLYIADAYFGLLVVGPSGGLATQLAGGFKFVDGVDVDLFTGNVYFNDASLTYDIRVTTLTSSNTVKQNARNNKYVILCRDTTRPGFKADATARLLRYNLISRQVSVLLSGLSGGGGPVVSSDGTFVLMPELIGKRIFKYWLVGPKANTAEVLMNVAGNPNKAKRAGNFGEFWVAVSNGYFPPTPLIIPQGVRFNSNGVVLQTVSFAKEFVNVSISLVQEQNRKLYVGSRFTNFIGVYSN